MINNVHHFSVIIVIICLMAFACLGYRLADWFTRYREMKHYFVYSGATHIPEKLHMPTNQLSPRNGSMMSEPIQVIKKRMSHSGLTTTSDGFSSDETMPRLTVTICNLNPMRYVSCRFLLHC